MKIINVNLPEHSYPIIIAENNFDILAWQLKKLSLGKDAFVLTNAKIFNLYAQELQNKLNKKGICCHFFKIKDSEESKSIFAYIKTLKAISHIDSQKRHFLIAFGGGVAGDLCGFVAATYKRGISYIQIPTTLLAQVDSSIGGKTGINLPIAKNLIGAFYQPRLVYSNLALLNSLPLRQIKSGLAEVVKYGIIADERLFKFVEKNCEQILELNKKYLMTIIAASSKIKAKIVEADEKETKGLRTILNFGHTIGHALETATKYKNLTHGEAISMGMTCAAEIAFKIGILDQEVFKRIENLIIKLKLPVRAKNIDFNAILDAFSRDKKFFRGKIRMVLPTRIGHVIVTEDVPIAVIKKVIKNRLT